MIIGEEAALKFIEDGDYNKIPKRFWKNRDFVLQAVKLAPWVLEYASDELRNDKEVVLEAVKLNGHAFKYASDELKNDKDVVISATKLNMWAIAYASFERRHDKELIRLLDIYYDPEKFSSLPPNYFGTNEQLAPFIEAVKEHLKNRVKEDVSQEDQEHATKIIQMVKDTIAKRRAEIDKIEQEKKAKAQRVKDYEKEIDEEFEQI